MLQRLLETPDAQQGRGGDGDIDGGVEDQVSGAFREEFGIGRADEGAVGPAEIVQFLRTEEMPKQVEVADVLDGAHVIEQLTGGVATLLGETHPSLPSRRRLGLVVGGVVGEESGVRLLRGATLNVGGLPHPTRIPADEVVSGDHIDGQRPDGGARRSARPTRVEEQRAPARGGRWFARQCDVQRRLARVFPVQRNLHRRALDALATGLPGDLLPGIRREVIAQGGWQPYRGITAALVIELAIPVPALHRGPGLVGRDGSRRHPGPRLHLGRRGYGGRRRGRGDGHRGGRRRGQRGRGCGRRRRRRRDGTAARRMGVTAVAVDAAGDQRRRRRNGRHSRQGS